MVAYPPLDPAEYPPLLPPVPVTLLYGALVAAEEAEEVV
jgi:hypothetical protein